MLYNTYFNSIYFYLLFNRTQSTNMDRLHTHIHKDIKKKWLKTNTDIKKLVQTQPDTEKTNQISRTKS